MAKNGNILNTISSLYRSLTKTEKKIADAILIESRSCGASAFS